MVSGVYLSSAWRGYVVGHAEKLLLEGSRRNQVQRASVKPPLHYALLILPGQTFSCAVGAIGAGIRPSALLWKVEARLKYAGWLQPGSVATPTTQ